MNTIQIIYPIIIFILAITVFILMYIESLKQDKNIANAHKLADEMQKQIHLQQKDFSNLADSYRLLAKKYNELNSAK